MTVRWIYRHPVAYELLDFFDSFGLTGRAGGGALMGVGGRVLEVGVGSGISARWLQGASLFGVDISLPMLRVARRRGAKVCVADGHNLPFKDGAFDFVLFLFSLRLMSDQGRALREALRVGRRVVVLEFVPLFPPLERFGFRVYGGRPLEEGIFEGLDVSREEAAAGLFVIYRVRGGGG